MKKQKSLPKLKAECQLVCNEYIRLRDDGLPCIACGENKPLQAGHYFAVQGYDGLRFNELNVHGECSRCNCFDMSHLIGYGENLLNRIGSDNFIELKRLAKDYKRNGYKWSRSELIEKIQYFKDKIKELKS
jgi:hypothetical protein